MSSATRLNLTGIFTLYSDSTVVLIRAVLHLISCCCFCFSVLAHTPALALAFSLAPTLALAPAFALVFALVFALGMMSGGFPKSAVLFRGVLNGGFSTALSVLAKAMFETKHFTLPRRNRRSRSEGSSSVGKLTWQ